MVVLFCNFNEFLKLSSDLISCILEGAVIIFNCISVSMGERQRDKDHSLLVDVRNKCQSFFLLLHGFQMVHYLNTNKIINILLYFSLL